MQGKLFSQISLVCYQHFQDILMSVLFQSENFTNFINTQYFKWMIKMFFLYNCVHEFISQIAQCYPGIRTSRTGQLVPSNVFWRWPMYFGRNINKLWEIMKNYAKIALRFAIYLIQNWIYLWKLNKTKLFASRKWWLKTWSVYIWPT